MPDAPQGGWSSRSYEQPRFAVPPRAGSARTLGTGPLTHAAGMAGDPRTLMDADLVAAGCPVDGLQHLLDERCFAEELRAYAQGSVSEPWLGALCGHHLLPDSLLVGPRPICPACVHAALPRLRAAHGRHAARRDPITSHGYGFRAVADRVMSMVLIRHGSDGTSTGVGVRRRIGRRDIEEGRA